MIYISRLFLAFLVLLLIVPQTPNANIVLSIFFESKIFANYGEAKKFLNILTWLSIFLFLLITFFSAFQ